MLESVAITMEKASWGPALLEKAPNPLKDLFHYHVSVKRTNIIAVKVVWAV